ncbi:MAG: DUF4097 family beta strand repeat-containing protein [Candidatus Coproplasma sp.]
MKSFKKSISVIFSAITAIALCAVCGCVSLGELWTDVNYANESAYTIGGGEIPENVNEIEIDWVCDDITIEHYSGTTVKVEESADKEIEEKFQLRRLVENGKLTVRFATCGRHDIRGLNKKLTVLIPEGVTLDKLTLKSVSGNITSKVSVKQAIVDNVSGSVTLENAVQSVDVESVSGSIELTLDGAAVTIDVVSGNVYLSVPETLGFTLTVATVSGKFNSSLEMAKNGDTYTRLGGGTNMTVDTVSGNINVTKIS